MEEPRKHFFVYVDGDNDIATLEKRINMHLDEGFILYGNMFADTRGGDRLKQGMYKFVDEGKTPMQCFEEYIIAKRQDPEPAAEVHDPAQALLTSHLGYNDVTVLDADTDEFKSYVTANFIWATTQPQFHQQYLRLSRLLDAIPIDDERYSFLKTIERQAINHAKNHGLQGEGG